MQRVARSMISMIRASGTPIARRIGSGSPQRPSGMKTHKPASMNSAASATVSDARASFQLAGGSPMKRVGVKTQPFPNAGSCLAASATSAATTACGSASPRKNTGRTSSGSPLLDAGRASLATNAPYRGVVGPTRMARRTMRTLRQPAMPCSCDRPGEPRMGFDIRSPSPAPLPVVQGMRQSHPPRHAAPSRVQSFASRARPSDANRPKRLSTIAIRLQPRAR